MSARGIVLDATIRISVAMESRPPPAQRRQAAEAGQERGPPPDLRRRGVRGRCDSEGAIGLVRRAYDAGVRISAGTDGMTPATDEWPALFEEMGYLHERVGMPMVDVIRAASLHGAVALGLEGEIGTVEEGKYANLVFLAEDPLLGTESLRSTVFTLKRGRRFDRADFELGDVHTEVTLAVAKR